MMLFLCVCGQRKFFKTFVKLFTKRGLFLKFLLLVGGGALAYAAPMPPVKLFPLWEAPKSPLHWAPKERSKYMHILFLSLYLGTATLSDFFFVIPTPLFDMKLWIPIKCLHNSFPSLKPLCISLSTTQHQHCILSLFFM